MWLLILLIALLTLLILLFWAPVELARRGRAADAELRALQAERQALEVERALIEAEVCDACSHAYALHTGTYPITGAGFPCGCCASAAWL